MKKREIEKWTCQNFPRVELINDPKPMDKKHLLLMYDYEQGFYESTWEDEELSYHPNITEQFQEEENVQFSGENQAVKFDINVWPHKEKRQCWLVAINICTYTPVVIKGIENMLIFLKQYKDIFE